jgi:hypothetical protein
VRSGIFLAALFFALMVTHTALLRLIPARCQPCPQSAYYRPHHFRAGMSIMKPIREWDSASYGPVGNQMI